MRKILAIIFVLAIILSNFAYIIVNAEEDFEKNYDYYMSHCSGNLTEADRDVCSRFMDYVASKNEDLNQQLEDIEAQREEIAANIVEKAKEIAGYNSQIEALNADIKVINDDINVLMVQIETKEKEISEKEVEIDAIHAKIKDRMAESQKTMRLNQYIDFLMGAKSFVDLIRRINGINAVVEYDKKYQEDLAVLVEELNAAKAELEKAKAELDVKKNELVEKQNQFIVLKKQAEVIQQEYQKQEADLEALGNRIAGNIEGIKKQLEAMQEAIGNIASSSSFTNPVVGARKSAGTWYYPASFGGGVHLGLDLAASIGTTVRAAANGIVIKSVDGCATVGYIGSSCGGAQGGSSGGGNQVYMLTRVDGTLYAIKYLHLQAGTPISTGTIVSAGDRIAGLGSSGNSSGAHVHIEVFKLGTMSINSYLNSWNGDLSFGTGWGSAGLNRKCSNVGAPCRERPEEIFGY